MNKVTTFYTGPNSPWKEEADSTVDIDYSLDGSSDGKLTDMEEDLDLENYLN